MDIEQLTDQFIAALNARDLEALEEVLAPDAEFRNPRGGALRGHDGARALVAAAEETRVRLEGAGEPATEEADGVTRVTVPVRVHTGSDAVSGTAVFEARDGRITAFEVLSELTAAV
jgi:ketosteroid isomerase-like protein